MTLYHRNALPTGYQLAEYQIESVLGHGGFGITYLARDTALGALVAIKEYLPHEIATRGGDKTQILPHPSREAVRDYHWGLKNFVKEARALAHFKHPNIVRVLRFLEANGTAYMVMEYEKGASLGEHLKRHGPRLDEQTLLRIFIPILNGLNAVHEAGMLHLDIKPENIYLRSDGSPMLIDFGSVRQAISGAGHVQRTALTHGYAPIEQYPDKGKPGPWTDVYAIGASLYRCISGQRPEDSLKRYQAILKYQVDPMKPAVLIGAQRYRKNLLECIDWAMQIYPNDRPQTARELQDALMGKLRPGRRDTPTVPPPLVTRPAGARAATASNGRRSLRSWRRQLRELQKYTGRIVLGALLVGSAWLAYLNRSDIAVLLAWLQTTPARPVEPPTDAVSAVPAGPPPSRTVAPAPARQPLAAGRPAPRLAPVAQPSAPPARLAQVLRGHQDWVQALAFSPDGRWLASAGTDKTIRIWDVQSFSLRGTLRGYNYPISSVAFSPDGAWLAAAGNDGSVRFWELKTAMQRGALRGPGGHPLFALAYAPDGKRIVAGGKDRTIFVWDVVSGKTLFTLEGHGGDVNALAIGHDGRVLASGGSDRRVILWDMHKGEQLAVLSGHHAAVLSVAFSPDGRWLVSGDADHALRIWNAADGSFVRSLSGVPGAVLALAFSRDSQWLAVGAADRRVRVFSIGDGLLAQELSGHEDFVQALAFSPSGLLASSGRDQKVIVWSPN